MPGLRGAFDGCADFEMFTNVAQRKRSRQFGTHMRASDAGTQRATMTNGNSQKSNQHKRCLAIVV
jgi:hypothetical protein